MARTSPKPPPPPTAASRWPAPLVFLLLFGAALAAYWPALNGNFLWDDLGHVTHPELQSWSGLWRIWFEVGVTQQYYPLLHSAFWIEHRLWGDAVVGYHLVNVLQHASAAFLFGLLLRRLFESNASPSPGLRAFGPGPVAAGHERRRYAGAEWFAAWLFLLHPVCAESVAWICEQKNTLSLVLYLGAALAYLRFKQSESENEGVPSEVIKPDARRTGTSDRESGGHRVSRDVHPHSHFHSRAKCAYALATFLFVGALLTKTVTASLPAALLVVGWWRRGRIDWRRDVVPLLPWFVLGAGGGLFTAHFERVLIGAQGADFSLGAMDRLVLAGRVFWFYLGKLVWPADLIFVYPRWSVDAAVWWQWLFPAAGLGLLAGLAWWSRRARGPLVAALLFGGSLFPVLGFVNVYPFVFSYVADHFQYLASLAVFALAGAGLSLLPRSAGRITATLLAGLFGVLTWNQASIYRDNVTLYEATLRRNPDAWLAHHNLATILIDNGRPDAALPHIERTLALRPDYPEALNNLGNCLTQLGRPGEALAPIGRAIKLQPRYAGAHNNLGAALMALDRAEEGRAQFELAVRLQPDDATAHRNLGRALASVGRMPDATRHFTRAVQLNPADGTAQLQLGTALAVQARYADALPHFEAALELDPESADAHLRLAMTLRSLGRTAEATEHYREAIRLNPSLGR